MPKFFSRTFGKKKNKKTKDEGDSKSEGDTGEASETSAGDGVGPLDFPDDCEGNTSGTDLVFVHGLRGSRLKTWSSGDIFWPRSLLKDDVKNARVITWGYDASVANVFTYASKESIFGHADTLLSDLARLRRGITRPIVFICHSLGGLVVKEALFKSATYNSHRRHPILGEIYTSTIGVIFLGTPHRGSSQETLGEVVANVAKLSLRQPNKQLLQTLKPDSHILENQRDQFTTISSNLNIVCIREELPTGAGLIVEEASASYDGFNVRRDAINANHMNIVKFASKEDEGYKRILGHINDIRNVQQLEIQQNILKALEFPTIHDREDGIDEAYAQTCSWILGHQSTTEASPKPSQFSSWLKNNETFFWISGKAGCGKSTLMKYVYQNDKTKEELSLWADGKDLLLAGYFFFDRGNEDQKSREGMLRSILHKILSARRDLIPKVFGQFFGDMLPLPQRFISWNSLSDAFISMLDHLRNSKICLFLDGLDEYRMIDRMDEYTEEELDLIYDGANEDEAWGQSTWIRDGHREITQFLRRFKNCDDVKVCVSSRELVVFEQEFRSFPRLQVHEHTVESIAQYCDGRLTEDAPDLIDHTEFVSSITEKSRGVFLWVRIVVDMLIDGSANGDSKEELLENLDDLPPRLGGKNGLYMRMVQTIERKYLPETKRLFQLVIQWASYASHIPFDIITLFLAEQGHLELDSEQEMRARKDKVLLKSWEESRPRWTDLQRRLKSRCGGLLEGTEKVQFMHQTAKEFMSRKYLWDKLFLNCVGFVGKSDMDLALLSGLIRRLKCCREATFGPGSLDDLRYFNDGLGLKIPDPSGIPGPPERGCKLLTSAITCTNSLSRTCDRLDHYVELLDELDNVFSQFARNWKDGLSDSLRRSPIANASWVVFCFRPALARTSANFKLESFLELAVLHDFFPYVEAKIRLKGVPRSQLQSLLLRATWTLGADWGVDGWGFYEAPKPELSELLLQEGADPNYRVVGSDVATASEEGGTVWTSLLGGGIIKQNFPWEEFMLGRWIPTVKIFLRYGADPTVQWPWPYDGEGKRAIEIATPGAIINAALADKPQYKEDFTDIMELLDKAKTNLGDSMAQRNQE
ncbi:hypothetical protein GP486_002011 [Trichoglossum hirsutum]|uniref:NACHT domain-containing protein n=1 Tax=Trichoglossum hirsutum TaxID=265104 RepID=A0A9P8RS37_9PEZI|nr:hypothetical protein GP486_002011 [Trichoglossum hirsutum]